MNAFGSPRPGGVQVGLIEAVEEVQRQVCMAIPYRGTTIRWP
jgi:hypothetical protein